MDRIGADSEFLSSNPLAKMFTTELAHVAVTDRLAQLQRVILFDLKGRLQ